MINPVERLGAEGYELALFDVEVLEQPQVPILEPGTVHNITISLVGERARGRPPENR